MLTNGAVLTMLPPLLLPSVSQKPPHGASLGIGPSWEVSPPERFDNSISRSRRQGGDGQRGIGCSPCHKNAAVPYEQVGHVVRSAPRVHHRCPRVLAHSTGAEVVRGPSRNEFVHGDFLCPC